MDYIWRGERFSELIGKSKYYDWIIVSHVIEHTPDFVSHLQQCEQLLKPTGFLSLVIPDKRYCFDFFQPVSSTGQVLDAYSEKRVKPSAGQVFDHVANAAKRKGEIAWKADDQGDADGVVHTFDEAKKLWDQSQTRSEYVDVHAWRFTPASFVSALSTTSLAPRLVL